MTVKASNTCVLLWGVISTASWLEFTARCASDVWAMRIAAAAVTLWLCYWGRKKNKHRGHICSSGAVNTGASLWVQAGSLGCSEQTNDSLEFPGDLTVSPIWMCLRGNHGSHVLAWFISDHGATTGANAVIYRRASRSCWPSVVNSHGNVAPNTLKSTEGDSREDHTCNIRLCMHIVVDMAVQDSCSLLFSSIIPTEWWNSPRTHLICINLITSNTHSANAYIDYFSITLCLFQHSFTIVIIIENQITNPEYTVVQRYINTVDVACVKT